VPDITLNDPLEGYCVLYVVLQSHDLNHIVVENLRHPERRVDKHRVAIGAASNVCTFAELRFVYS
jgi:hypothetical protein